MAAGEVYTPVPPLLLFKGTHHRSEFHGERVFLKSACPQFCKKGSVFGLDICIFLKRGSFFSIFNSLLIRT